MSDIQLTYNETTVQNFGQVMVDFDGCEYYIFQSRDDAGAAAREYWEDMANNDVDEFTCMVGSETLVKWALGQWAGPGTSQVQNLDEWLDLYLDAPEEHFASYDGCEVDATIDDELKDELDYHSSDVVLYRHN